MQNSESPDVTRREWVSQYQRKPASVFRHRVSEFKRRMQGDRHNKIRSSVSTSYSVQDVRDKLGDNPICYLTGQALDLTNTVSWTFDHVIPVSRGGSNDISNLDIVGRQANYVKGSLLVEELLSICKDILRHNGYAITRN